MTGLVFGRRVHPRPPPPVPAVRFVRRGVGCRGNGGRASSSRLHGDTPRASRLLCFRLIASTRRLARIRDSAIAMQITTVDLDGPRSILFFIPLSGIFERLSPSI